MTSKDKTKQRKTKKKSGITRSSTVKNDVSSGVSGGPETETPERENLIMVGGVAGFSESNKRPQTFAEFTRKIQTFVNTKSTS